MIASIKERRRVVAARSFQSLLFDAMASTTTTTSSTSNRMMSREESGFSGAGGAWGDDSGLLSDGQLFFVTSYSDFDKLAHGPRGSQAKHPLYVYRFHPDGSLVLLNVLEGSQQLVNPAFSRHHTRLNVVYTCTEDIDNNGLVFAYTIGPNGELSQLGQPVDAGGTSTCYLTIDKTCTHLLCVNYWDSTLSVIPLDVETGEMRGPVSHIYDPKEGKQMISSGRVHGGVNHSNNDDSTIRMRQADPHSHALVLDPLVGTVAYVPDLGKDLIREFYYKDGKIGVELNVMPSGLCTGMPDGPRYIDFHPKYNVAYVVNELSSTIAVFEVDRTLLRELQNARDPSKYKGRSTLRLIQSIKTIPSAFPTIMNTCGRICVHKSGRFVVVSNRGHQSIACFRVIVHGSRRGELVQVGHFHTRGETPRHFQFDASGQFLLVANQDSDSLAVFSFNLSSGQITYTGNEYRLPSPNFVCCCPLYQEEDDNHDAPVILSNLDAVVDPQPTPVVVGEISSECSTTSSTVEVHKISKERALEEELERARFEIAELKKLLSSCADESRDLQE